MAEQEAEATQRGEALAMDALEKAFDAEKATLYAQKRALAADVAQFQDEQKRARLAAPPADEVVKLNVGGVHFETSRGVLTRVEDSMLGRMFARNDAPKDPTDGSIFIDRDGARFGMLLDFLRGDPPNDRAMRASLAALPQLTGAAMLQEIEYFGLQNAVFGSRPWTVSATFRAGPEMREGRSFFASVNAGNRVIVFGGSLDGSELFTTEVLDVETLQFSNGPDLAKGITEFAAVTLDADRVLVVGGINGAGEYPTATEILTLSTLTLSPGPT
ncbi:BTB/POZ protein [Pelagophyceae sp. CCMP2097]|nr:BTB/POZ protein [Pelagophyceae sp. CCMP2097]